MIDTGARIYDPHYSTQILSIDERRPPWRESDGSVVRLHGWPEAAAAPCIRRWSIIFSNGTKHGLIPTTNFPRTTSTMNPSHQRSKSKRPSSLKFPTRRFSIIYCLEGLDLAHSIMPHKSVEILWDIFFAIICSHTHSVSLLYSLNEWFPIGLSKSFCISQTQELHDNIVQGVRGTCSLQTLEIVRAGYRLFFPLVQGKDTHGVWEYGLGWQ